MKGLSQTFFLLASCALVASAHASYGQMRLEGINLLLAFLLMIAYGLIVDVALFTKIFRHRAAVVVASILALVVVLFLLSQIIASGERAGFFKGLPGGRALVVLVTTSAVFLPFIVIAPFAQYVAMRDDRRWPGWIPAWMALQLALLPTFIVLAFTDDYYFQKEYVAGEAEGRQAAAGGLGGILELAEQKHERIWGTGWAYPSQKSRLAGSEPSAWNLGLGRGMDASALIAASERLSAPDRDALQTLVERHFVGDAVPQLRAKLLWETLEPGSFSKQLAATRVREETIPVLLERFEKDGGARLCPGGRMIDKDRAALKALLVAKADFSSEIRAGLDRYQRRVDRLCQS